MNFQIHNHVDTGRAYDLIVTLIKFKLKLRDRVWPCSAIACCYYCNNSKPAYLLLHCNSDHNTIMTIVLCLKVLKDNSHDIKTESSKPP